MIVCSAYRLPSGLIASLPAPAWHEDIVGLMPRGIFDVWFSEIGFLTDRGEFVSREDALKHIRGSEQGRRVPEGQREVYDHDLWPHRVRQVWLRGSASSDRPE